MRSKITPVKCWEAASEMFRLICCARFRKGPLIRFDRGCSGVWKIKVQVTKKTSAKYKAFDYRLTLAYMGIYPCCGN